MVVVDGVPGEPFETVSWPPAINDDASVIAYAARIGDRQYCVVGTEKSAPFQAVDRPVVDGTRVAFAASSGSRWFVVLNGEPGPDFHRVGNVVLNETLAYTAQDESFRSYVVVNHRPGHRFDRVTAPTIGANGRTVAYGALRDGRWFVVVDDLENPVHTPVESVFLDSEGTRAGYIFDGSVFDLQGHRGPGFEWIGWPTFTADGRVLYFASRGRTKLLVDQDRVMELGDWVIWDPIFENERVSFGAKVGRDLVWKVLSIRTAFSE